MYTKTCQTTATFKELAKNLENINTLLFKSLVSVRFFLFFEGTLFTELI